ncbi:MAG: hypothetical protein WDA20_10815 [Desulfuromonadales bacterium]|jgi:hypothetical protein
MKAYFIMLLVLVGGCFGLQIWFYLAHIIEKRTRPFHEREGSPEHS